MTDNIRHGDETREEAALQTRAESARVESGYETLDLNATKTAFEELDKVLDGLVGQVINTIDQIIPHLAEMQSLLSQRGKARKKVLKAAGLPSWPEYGLHHADFFNR
jgi:phage-related protein